MNNQNPVKIYASKRITRYIQRRLSNGGAVKKQHLNILCVPNGEIAVGTVAGTSGVFDQSGVLVKQSLNEKYVDLRIPPAASPYFDYDAVYLGNIHCHFGEHLLEHWNRAYAFLYPKYTNMKFAFANDKQIAPIPAFVLELAHLLGISTENLVILDKSTRFKNVYVPEPGFKKKNFSSREFGEIYTRIANNIETNTVFEKIYVSRAALSPVKKVYGEEKVQQIFEKNGYHIAYPEQLPLKEQIALMKGCKSLAGCAGTALHLALFMPNGGNVIQIKRNSGSDDNSLIQYLITETKEHDLVFIEASIENHKTNHFEFYAAQIIGITKHMKRFFDDYGFNYSQNDLEFDKKSWNEYNHATKLIETWMRKKYGKTKFQIYILHRIAKIMSCFIPNRLHRQHFRNKMKKAWGIEQVDISPAES